MTRNRVAVCVFAAMASLSSGASAAVMMSAWTFNGPQGTLAPSSGDGVAVAIGGVSSSFSTGVPADNRTTIPAENKGWNLASFAAQGTGSGERGCAFTVATTGYQAIVVSWYERHSNSSSRFTQFQYSLDGTTFTSDGLSENGVFEASLGGDIWQTQRRMDLGKIAGVAGNAKFAIRVVSVFAPGTSAYAATGLTGNYSAAGTLRFDLVQVEGVAIPAPAVTALGAAGIALVARGSRRRS